MGTYVREKVLRIPTEKTHVQFENNYLDSEEYVDEKFPELFDYATPDKFQFSPAKGVIIIS